MTAAILATWPTAARMTSGIPGDIGDPLLNAWILAWDADRFLHFGRGLWDAPIFFPYRGTLAYSEHLLGIAPFVAPVLWIFGNPLIGYNIAFLLAYAGCFAGMYLLAREVTGRRDAAIVAAAAYGFAPYRAAQISHLQVLACGWLPVAMWGLHRFFNRGRAPDPGPRTSGHKTRGVRAFVVWPGESFERRRVVALAVFVGAYALQALSNGYFLYFCLLPFAVVAAAELWKAWPRVGRTVTYLAAAAVVFLMLMSPIVAAYLSLWQQGFLRSYGELTAYSADLADYGRISRALKVWRGVLPRGAVEHELFPGVTVIILGIVAAVKWRRAPTMAYVVIVVIAVVMSLGPEPHVWGRKLASWGPYNLALSVLPGMTGLRVPARLGVIVAFGLSVLAGLGTAAIAQRLDRRSGIVLTAALACIIAAEGWSAPVSHMRFDVRGLASDRVAYEWLAGAPPGGVLELPIAGPHVAPFTMRYQFGTLIHRHQIVNGYSGYRSALQDFLDTPASPIRERGRIPDLLAALRGLGVRYVVLHHRAFRDREAAAAINTAVDGAQEHVAARHVFGDTLVWVLKESGAKGPNVRFAGAQVPARELTVHASSTQERVAEMLDGVTESRWLTNAPQQGNEALTITLNAPRDIARVTMTLTRRSFGDYPRDLLIESSDDGRTYTQLYRGSVLPQFIQGLVRDATHAAIDVDLPRNATRILRLRQLGRTRSWYWSIHEMQLSERRSY